MTEPPDGESLTAEVRVTGVAARSGQDAKKHDLFEKMKWDRVGSDKIPVFAPAAELAGNPRRLAGARLVCMTDARQTLLATATMVRRAAKGDTVTLFAYSFDHPTVTSGILEAVYRGAEVSIYMDYGYVCGCLLYTSPSPRDS